MSPVLHLGASCLLCTHKIHVPFLFTLWYRPLSSMSRSKFPSWRESAGNFFPFFFFSSYSLFSMTPSNTFSRKTLIHSSSSLHNLSKKPLETSPGIVDPCLLSHRLPSFHFTVSCLVASNWKSQNLIRVKK